MTTDGSPVLRFADRRVNGQLPVSDSNGNAVAYTRTARYGSEFVSIRPDGSPLCSGETRQAHSPYSHLWHPDGRPLGELWEGVRPRLQYVIRKRSFVKVEGHRPTVMLAGGPELAIHPIWSGRGWVLVDPAGAVLLQSVEYSSVERFGEHPEQQPTVDAPRSGMPVEAGPPEPSVIGLKPLILAMGKVLASVLTQPPRWDWKITFPYGRDDWLVTPYGFLDLAQIVAIVEMYRLVVKDERKRNEHVDGD